MKRILKTLLLIIIGVIVAMTTRALLKRFAPGLYGTVWGGSTLHERKEVPPVEHDISTPSPPNQEPSKPKEEPQGKGEELYATGKLWSHREVIVVMSDGTVRSMEDNTEPGKPRVERIRKRFMDMEGKRYYWTPRKETAERPPRSGEILEPKPPVKTVLKEEAIPEMAQTMLEKVPPVEPENKTKKSLQTRKPPPMVRVQ